MGEGNGGADGVTGRFHAGRYVLHAPARNNRVEIILDKVSAGTMRWEWRDGTDGIVPVPTLPNLDEDDSLGGSLLVESAAAKFI